MTAVRIDRAGPLVTIQDRGRFGVLRYGISASGPMDRGAFERGGAMLSDRSGTSAIEFTRAGLEFSVEGALAMTAFTGGSFSLAVNGESREWGRVHPLRPGDRIDITPGAAGNYGYVRFDHEIDVPLVLDSRSTNIVAGLGGHAGRALRTGDWLMLRPLALHQPAPSRRPGVPREGPIRVVWGLHAERFDASTRLHLEGSEFEVSHRLDRMGVSLLDPGGAFSDQRVLSLVSDAIVPGDIQILGDGTPIVLMRDHQPTGGYPRIATVISVDMDRFAQLRPGAKVRFEPVTVRRARALLLEAA